MSVQPADSTPATGHALLRGQPGALRAVTGQPLGQALTRYHRQPTPLAFHDLLRHFVAACYEVAFAHSTGKLHLRLTPQQVLLGPFGDTAVVGWEPADRQVPSGAAGIDPQSGAYLAPEQVARPPQPVTAAADVHALGGILYAILTGHAPHEGATPDEVDKRIREGLVWPPALVAPKVPPALESVCLKALAPRPEERYSDAAALARDVERWLAGERPEAAPEQRAGLVAWLRRCAGRGVGGALLLVAVLGAGWLGFAAGRRPLAGLRTDNGRLREQFENARAAAETQRQQRVQLSEVLTRLNREHAAAAAAYEQALLGLKALALLAQRQPHDTTSVVRLKQQLVQAAREATQRMAQRAAQFPLNDRRATFESLHLADLFLLLGEPERARSHYEGALALARQRLQSQVEDHTAHDDLLKVARGYAQALLVWNEIGPARELCREALPSATKLAEADPSNLSRQRELVAWLERISLLSVRMNDVTGARQAYEQLRATTEMLLQRQPSDPTNLYNVACCLALCAAAVAPGKPDAERTAAERAERKEHVQRALDTLRQAVAAGFRDLAHLETDPDLAALRGEPEYAALVALLRARQAGLTFPALP